MIAHQTARYFPDATGRGISAEAAERFARALWLSWWRSVNGRKADPPQEAIYALCCPISKQVRYIGRTNDPIRRFSEHVSRRASPNMKEWISGLRVRNKSPALITLAFVDECDGDKAERMWIRYFRDKVNLLLNDVHHRRTKVHRREVALSFDEKTTASYDYFASLSVGNA